MTQAKLAQAFVPSDPGEKARKLEEENKLLISQLLQVQEELGRYFKLYKELEAGGGARAEPDRPDYADTSASEGWAGLLASRLHPLFKLGLFRGLARRLDLSAIRKSGFFDAAWYSRRYPDVAKTGVDPAKHYYLNGAKEGRNPGPGFDTRWYLKTYPDVAKAGINLSFTIFATGDMKAGGPVQCHRLHQRPVRV